MTVTREYIAGILCAMQVAGDDEASAAIEKFIVQLEAEIERLDKAFDFSAVKVAEARAENEALKKELRTERRAHLANLLDADGITPEQYERAVAEIDELTGEQDG